MVNKKKIPNIKIRAIHINHNINESAKNWIKHCQLTCKKYNIPLIIKSININQDTSNLEEILRKKRYNIFYQTLIINETLLTGHHLNDQCETFFLALKRGSGITGLSGMSKESIFGNKKILRPLLNIHKKKIKIWAIKNHLTWIEDPSNTNTTFDRNFIRNKILPILENKWPFFLKNCFRSAHICNQEKILLDNFLKKDMSSYIESDYSLNISNFCLIQKNKCQSMLRYWISVYNIKLPSYKMIQYIYNHMIFSRQDANPQIILQKKEIRRYKNRLYCLNKQKTVKNTIFFWHDINKPLYLTDELGMLEKNNQGMSLPIPKNNELINIRFQHSGLILIQDRNKKRKIQKIWQEKNIPPWLRNHIPLLFYNDNFISALGLFVINTNNCNQKEWKVSWINNIKNKKNFFIFV